MSLHLRIQVLIKEELYNREEMWKILGKYLHYQLTKAITIFHPNITNPDRVTKSAWIIGASKVYSESMMKGSR